MMTLASFFGQFVVAVLLLAGMIYLPGKLLLRIPNLKLDSLEHLGASLLLGMSLLVLVYWGLAYLHVPSLLWVYVLVGAGWEAFLLARAWITRLPVDTAIEDLVEPLSRYWPLGLLMLAAMAGQGWFMVFSGWEGANGMTFYAWHYHDAPWHVYNLFQLSRHFPPQVPGFAGFVLNNYHMFSDLLWGAMLRIIPLNPWHIYFRVAPFLYSGLMSLAVFLAARVWSGEEIVAYLATGFTALLSSFGYILPLVFGLKHYFFWDSIFWVQSPLGNIFNPGVASSYGLMMMGLWALKRWKDGRRLAFLALVVLAWGVLPGFKVYPALLLMAALLVTGLVRSALNEDKDFLRVFIAVLPLFLLVFLPPNLHASSLIRWLPGFNLATMLVAPDRMALMSSASLKLLYVRHPALAILTLAGLIPVFVIGNLGVRSLGLIPMVRTLLAPRDSDPILLFLTIFSGGALLASILLVQTGIQWNTIQFFYYAVLVSALPAAAQLWKWLERLRPGWRYAWLGVVIALGLPCTIQAWCNVNWGLQASPAVCEACAWLRQEARPDAVILRPLPEDLQTDAGYAKWQHSQERGRMTSLKAWQQEAGEVAQAVNPAAAGGTVTAAAGMPNPVQPAGWMDSAFVAALSGRNTFLEDTVSAQIMGKPVAARVAAVRHFYTQANVIEARELLEDHKITYVMTDTGYSLPFKPEGVPLKKVFSNASITIYKYLPQAVWE